MFVPGNMYMIQITNIPLKSPSALAIVSCTTLIMNRSVKTSSFKYYVQVTGMLSKSIPYGRESLNRFVIQTRLVHNVHDINNQLPRIVVLHSTYLLYLIDRVSIRVPMYVYCTACMRVRECGSWVDFCRRRQRRERDVRLCYIIIL